MTCLQGQSSVERSPGESSLRGQEDSENASVREWRKAVLTCPRCAHTSPVEGDWIRTSDEAGTAICCPDCHKQLTVRH